MSCKLDRWTRSNLPAIHLENKWIWCYVNKTEANLASASALAARCVRVIHAQCVLQFALLSRTLLRSSSNNEPSDPPYRIIFRLCIVSIRFIFNDKQQWFVGMERFEASHGVRDAVTCWLHNGATQSARTRTERDTRAWDCAKLEVVHDWKQSRNGNDPYAGSPTNTLLRLLLPLNDPVWASFRYKPNDPKAARKTKPKISLKHSIGSSDGRCVQRTGT